MKKSLVLAIKLLVICAVAAAALAFTNAKTAPIIADRKAKEAAEAYKAVYPDAEELEVMKDESLLTKNIREIAEVKKGGQTVGYVFNVSSPPGYGGPLEFAIGVQTDGAVQGFQVLAHQETSNFGSRVTEDAYKQGMQGVYLNAPVIANGQGGQEHEVPLMSGATITSTAMESAFNLVVEKLAELTGNTVDMTQKPEKAKEDAEEPALSEEELQKKAYPNMTKIEPMELSHEGINAAYRVFEGDQETGYLFAAEGEGYGGPFHVYVGVNKEGLVQGFSVIDNQETPGFGKGMEEVGFEEAMIGKKVLEAPVEISGATITSDALHAVMKQVESAFEAVKQGGAS